MPCLTPFADNAQEVSTQASADQAKLKQRIAFLEAALCGTRKAMINANRELGRSIFTGLDYEEMGITGQEYVKGMAEHAERDFLKNPPKPRVIGDCR